MPVLTNTQIEEAKKLKELGKTKRELAIIFNVGSTTIWDHVYRIKREPLSGPKCNICEIILKESVEICNGIAKIPHNFKLGDKCISCILHDRGIQWDEMQKYGIKITTK